MLFLQKTIFLLMLFSPPIWAQSCHVTPAWSAMESLDIEVMQANIKKALTVRIANDNAERAAGYQWICQQDAAQTAVLFIFPKEITTAFHMRNVFVPLAIYFFDDTGKQIGATVMRPEPPGQPIVRRYYSPQKAFRYALEIARPLAYNLQSTPLPLELLINSVQIGSIQ